MVDISELKSKEKKKDRTVIVGCSIQGIEPRSLAKKEVIDWCNNQIDFWDSISFSGTVIINSSRFSVPNFVGAYKNHWNRVISKIDDGEGDYSILEETLERSRRLDMILADGTIAEKVRAYSSIAPEGVFYTIASYSQYVLDSSSIDERIRSAVFSYIGPIQANPIRNFANDLVRVGDIKKSLESQYETTLKLKSDLEDEYISRCNQFDDLRDRYETKLVLEGPSVHWRGVAQTAERAAYIWLGVFILSVVIPVSILLSLYSVEDIGWFIKQVTPDSGFSIASIILVSAPLLGYAWILKHLSRNYIQNTQIAADARHRRVMAITYLGLMRRKTSGIAEAERALILNALFRPAPPNSAGDDGPPLGLLDMLKSKS